MVVRTKISQDIPSLTPTGEVRRPLKGEWFLSDGIALYAFRDFQEKELPILREVIGEAN